MHYSFLLAAIVILLGLVITTVCLWLSLKLFGLKADKNSSAKIVGLEAVFLVLVGLIGSTTKGSISTLFSLLFIFGGVVLWVMFLKRFASSKYSLGRAIGSYVVGYIFTTVVAVAVAILGIVFFAQVFKIDGDSMAPALKANQTVLVYKFEKHPNKGDVIVYTNQETGKQALGRVQGMPGETVTVTAGSGVAAASERKLDSTEYYVITDNVSYHIPNRVIKADSIVGTIGPKL